MKKLKLTKLKLHAETVAHLKSRQLENVQSGNMNAPASDTRGVCTPTRDPGTDAC